jgi:hypothetical protein
MPHTTATRRPLWICLALLAALACVPPPPPGAIYAARRPPSDQVEVMVVSPGSGHVWVRGYWRWERNDFVWVRGRWMPVERGYRTWVPGRWRHHRRGWYWVDGHWGR